MSTGFPSRYFIGIATKNSKSAEHPSANEIFRNISKADTNPVYWNRKPQTENRQPDSSVILIRQLGASGFDRTEATYRCEPWILVGHVKNE